MQENCDAWFKELLQMLEGSVARSQLEGAQVSDKDRASLIATTFDVRRFIELIHLAQELTAKEHLCDHKSTLPAKSASMSPSWPFANLMAGAGWPFVNMPGEDKRASGSGRATTIGIMYDEKTHIISNLLVGGPASSSKKIFKGDTIVSIDGNDVLNGNIHEMLVGSDKADSVVTLGLKSSTTGKVAEVKLRRKAIRRLADKTRMFELFTNLSNCAKRDQDIEAERHLQEIIDLWTAEMTEQAEHDELVNHNVHEMQENCDVWFKELLQMLEGSVARSQLEGAQVTAGCWSGEGGRSKTLTTSHSGGSMMGGMGMGHPQVSERAHLFENACEDYAIILNN
jgi:hypothetical protein